MKRGRALDAIGLRGRDHGDVGDGLAELLNALRAPLKSARSWADTWTDQTLIGGAGPDALSGGWGDDLITGGPGDDSQNGGWGDDRLSGGLGDDAVEGGWGSDVIIGGPGADHLDGGWGDDVIESGAGDDVIDAGWGDDLIYAFSWGGEPDPAQGGDRINPDEPVSDDDVITLGGGADTVVFRWLLDATDAVLAANADDDGDIDYSGDGVAGANANTHDHWVESMGTKTVTDYDPEEDSLYFEGHTLELTALAHDDVDGDGALDTVARFNSQQGAAGAHDEDDLGTVILLGVVIEDIAVTANVNYGVTDPYTDDNPAAETPDYLL